MSSDHQRVLAYEPALDGMRGVAIAGVVSYHAFAQSGGGSAGWVGGGFIGVSVFFTLSGFLITSLLLREHAMGGRIDTRHFWSRRIRRLVPAALAVVLAVVALSTVVDVLDVRSSDAIAATWSVTNWHVIAGGQDSLLQTIVGPLGPTWSLGVEEQFYLVLVAVVLLSFRWTRRPRRTLLIVSAVGIVVPTALANLTSDWLPRLEFGTDLRAAESFAGVALALWVTSDRPPRWSPRAADGVAATGVATIVGLFLLADYTPPWLLRGGYALVAAVTAATLLGLLQHGRVAGWLSGRPVVGLGLISYSLYLVHWPVMSVMTQDRTGTSGAGLALVQIGVSLAVATVLHLGIERPFRRRRRPAWRPTLLGWLAASTAVTAISVTLPG